MAAFFANVQVRMEDRLAVMNAVQEVLARTGFEPEAEAFGGDRSVYIGPALNGWIGVYDSACDGYSVGPLAWLGQSLSAELDAVTLAWFVYDSALLIYVLFVGGEVVDRYVSHPDYFAQTRQEPGKGPQPPLGGDGKRLLTVTEADGDGVAVSRWLRRPDPFVQLTLRRVADVLGQEHAELGHDEVEADQLAESHLEELTDFYRLDFVRADG